MLPRTSAEARRTRAPAAVMALSLAAAAVAAPACSKRPVDPPRSARAPLTRLFPTDRPSRPLRAEAGQRVLWRGAPGHVRGLEMRGLDGEAAPGGVLRLRRRGADPPLLAFPVRGPSEIAASEVRAIRARVVYAKPQPRPPLARASMQTTHPERGETWVRGGVTPGRPDGTGWTFELLPGDGSARTGTMTAMRLELVGFAGDSAEMGAVDVL